MNSYGEDARSHSVNAAVVSTGLGLASGLSEAIPHEMASGGTLRRSREATDARRGRDGLDTVRDRPRTLARVVQVYKSARARREGVE